MNQPDVTSITDLQRFLLESTPTVPIFQFLPALVGTAILCALVGLFYQRYGQSLSNRESLARIFPAVGMTTMLVITIVKSSLALSLGLVGALSIVRFRTAIKEPEELAYLFLTIGIGLGLGASQWLVTLSGFVVILGVLWVRARSAATDEGKHLYLTIRQPGASGATLGSITRTLQEHCTGLDLKRFDEAQDGLEASYRVSFESYEQLERAKQALRAISGAISLSFVDQEAVL
ncbi:MAG: DUF4956 domain-containing protein [Proteobacteria bacterium]|nr:MAG: DUF4956 domain-containing protein [Pseudomonadota bacterium]